MDIDQIPICGLKPLEKYLSRRDIPSDIKEAIRKAFTERKKVEESLRRHLQMLDFAEDTIMIRNLKDRITYWNQGAARHYGWTKEEALGKHVHSFLKTVFPKPLKTVLKTCRREGYWEGELTHTRKDGSRVIVFSRWTLQRDALGNPVAFLEINNDVTKLKQAEQALRKAHDGLEKRVEERTAELKAMNQELKRSIQEQRRLEKEVLEISGLEQRRIGQDLHDGLSQQLTGIALMARGLEQKLVGKSLSEAGRVRKIVELVNQAILETRALARGLYPVELESNGLMAALEELALNTKRLFNVTSHFDCAQPILIHDNVMATHLYRIAQEAVNNAVKHSGTRQVWISLVPVNGESEKVCMQVRDEGRGIPEKFSGKGMGLRLMHYRAEMIQASLEIARANGRGTVVTCTFPRERIKGRKGSRSS